nr:MAG TPA: hypothetical protein [Caudoviricetes sp.]
MAKLLAVVTVDPATFTVRGGAEQGVTPRTLA